MSAHFDTQDERILAILTKNINRWVPTHLLADKSDSIAAHTRFDSLRKKGHKVRVTCVYENGKPESYTMLMSDEKFQAWRQAGFPLKQGERHTRLTKGDGVPVVTGQTLAALTDAVTYARLPTSLKAELAKVIDEALADAGWEVRWDAGQVKFVAGEE